MFKRLNNLSDRAILKILIGSGLITTILSFFVSYINGADTTPSWWAGWMQNFSTEMFGAFFTFVLLALILGGRQEKERLIRQMRSSINVETIRAVEELRAHGWLEDGSLEGADLRSANLQGANMKKASLREADLSYTDIRKASLDIANLQKVNLRYSKLQEASLVYADLQMADLVGANLNSASLGFANMENSNLADTDLKQASLKVANLRGAQLGDANLENVRLEDTEFDETTILPDGSKWTSDTDLTRFTNPEHPQFWRPKADQRGELPQWYKLDSR